MPETMLVTGGAGYIGSHTCWLLLESGRRVVVVDDLSRGYARLIPDDAVFVRGCAGDIDLVRSVIRDHGVETVLHFAGSVIVPESVADPLTYYRNNVCVTRNLIQACVEEGADRFVFSSTAAVYGNVDAAPVSETAPLLPKSPYGHTKLMIEQMLGYVSEATDLRHVALRYFNVAGADPEGRTGQICPDATHLIKVACEVAVGTRDGIKIFGDDYPTADGTCIRDFIHVSDLAQAHVAALDYLGDGGPSVTLNCGYGRGASVRDVLATVERIARLPLDAKVGARRPGDAIQLVADNRKIIKTFDWSPRYDDLETIVRTALAWERSLAQA